MEEKRDEYFEQMNDSMCVICRAEGLHIIVFKHSVELLIVINCNANDLRCVDRFL